jgi:hypothetical protein
MVEPCSSALGRTENETLFCRHRQRVLLSTWRAPSTDDCDSLDPILVVENLTSPPRVRHIPGVLEKGAVVHCIAVGQPLGSQTQMKEKLLSLLYGKWLALARAEPSYGLGPLVASLASDVHSGSLEESTLRASGPTAIFGRWIGNGFHMACRQHRK